MHILNCLPTGWATRPRGTCSARHRGWVLGRGPSGARKAWNFSSPIIFHPVMKVKPFSRRIHQAMRNPVSDQPVLEPQMARRKVLCKHYGDCLSDAVSRGWESFHCADCTAFSVLNWTNGQWEQDAHLCAALVRVVFCPSFQNNVNEACCSNDLSSVDLESQQGCVLLRPSEVSSLLDSPLKEVLSLCWSGTLSYVRVGKLIRIKSESVIEYAQTVQNGRLAARILNEALAEVVRLRSEKDGEESQGAYR